MNEITFFTPIQYITPHKSRADWLLQKADAYFYHWGKKVYVIQGRTADGKEEVIVADGQSSLLASALKVVTYFTVVMPLFLLLVKAGLRATHNFQQVTVQQKLAEGIDVSESTKSKIQELMPKILTGQDDPEIEWISRKKAKAVFRLKESADLVYKVFCKNDNFEFHLLTPKLISDIRFANKVKAKEVCLVNQQHLLVIPRAVQFEVEVEGTQYPVIAEEHLDFEPDDSLQEELYQKHAAQLNETFRELAIFDMKTDFSVISWGKNPVLNEDSTAFSGSRRVALLNPERYSSECKSGLIDCCVSKEQIDIVSEVYSQMGLLDEYFNWKHVLLNKVCTAWRIQDNQRLSEFYSSHKITGKELLKVDDIETLGLDLTEKATASIPCGLDNCKLQYKDHTFLMRDVVECVINEINERISHNPDRGSVKRKRKIWIEGKRKQPWDKLRLTDETDESKQKSWLCRILQALKEKEHIFNYEKSKKGYDIQA